MGLLRFAQKIPKKERDQLASDRQEQQQRRRILRISGEENTACSFRRY
jgi:hypothetical protein